MSKDLSHINDQGQAEMVDITQKGISDRIAIASGKVNLSEEMMGSLRDQGFSTKKGSIIQTAIIAGTMAVKRTYDTIPLCHQTWVKKEEDGTLGRNMHANKASKLACCQANKGNMSVKNKRVEGAAGVLENNCIGPETGADLHIAHLPKGLR